MNLNSEVISEIIKNKKNENSKDFISGKNKKYNHNINLERYEIKTKKQSKYYGKEIGIYDLISIPDILNLDDLKINYLIKIICNELNDFLKFDNKSKLLIVGLGNRHISSDSLGTKCITKINITLNNNKLPRIMCFCPSVLGLTGIETYDILSGLVSVVNPTHLILIDSLCAGDVSRLGKSIQITNSGICPGSGIGNNRKCIDNSLVKNIVTIGVPLLIYASTFVKNSFENNSIQFCDLDKLNSIMQTFKNKEDIRFCNNLLNKIKDVYLSDFDDLIVSIKDIEECVDKLSYVISSAINSFLGTSGIK